MQNVSVKRTSIPLLLNRQTVYDISADEISKIDNILNAFKYVFSKVAVLNYKEICTINSIVDYGRDDFSEGKIRKTPVQISGTNWKPLIPNEEQLKNELLYVLGISDTVDRSIEMLLFLMKKQMFADGNKRTAQFFSAEMLENERLIISVPLHMQKQFSRFLLNYYENEKYKGQIKEFVKTYAVFERKDF
ncbi:MAG: Fic family protein [Ruminococcus sp.]|nr:Fic family protein [Ruminococcus sp.]